MITRRALCLAPAAAPLLSAADNARVLTLDLSSGGPYAFPPSGKAYKENGPSHRIWRQIRIEAPDCIVLPGGKDFGLNAAGVRIHAERPKKIPKSALRREQQQRMARPPRVWMEQWAGQYGQELREMVYTLSFSVWGRLRAGQTEAVRPILAPFLDGRMDALAKPTASHFSGHLTLAAWHDATGDTRARERVLAAAALARQNPLHNEMSDSVFMVCPLLVKAGRYTGDVAWLDASLRHWETMRNLCLRKDGLYRHSPLDEAAWGRGNAFPLLGLALALTDLPVGHPAHAQFLAAFRSHAARLLTFQTEGGCWRQVIDHKEAWEEFTCTAMIGCALLRGLRHRWLEGKETKEAVHRAWRAIQRRSSSTGELVDVCESTGKQKTLTDYLNREALLGKDPRGGAMALQFAAELAT
ncbi:MAG TPA: glycoside hydrolase family 88 protein [Bryobacteraceae bacterium]|nr:glycoside hydrolase family 88 protein [Bryobacteraceae bacterium]